MTVKKQLSRPEKLNNAQTILYEIDMLRFAKDRLLSSSPLPLEKDIWIYLESFLLHYRNLLEFFRGDYSDETDLSISKPIEIWGEQHPHKTVLDQLVRPDLWRKYDTRRNPISISKYLHHCTRHRVNQKSWNVAEMYQELRPVLDRFESLLPMYKPLAEQRGASALITGDMTTTSTSSTRTI